MSTLRLFISSLELKFSVTSLNIFMCGVVMSMSWIPCFNRVVNSQNGSRDLIAGSFLGSLQIIQVILLWSSTQILAICSHNSMWYFVVTSAQSSLFILRNNLLISGMNFISMIFSTQWLLMIMLRLPCMNNGLFLPNFSRDNAWGFALLKFFFLYPDSNPRVAYLPTTAATPIDISLPATAPDPTPDPSPALIIPPNPSPSPYPLVP